VAVRAKAGGGAEVSGAAGEKPGWTFETNDGDRYQVQEVQVYADGLVEIQVGIAAGSYCFAPLNAVISS
jgi:hypothetical protein